MSKETIEGYFERRTPILALTTQLAEKFSSYLVSKFKDKTPVSTQLGEVTVGMGRLYNALTTVYEEDGKRATFTSFMISPHQRSVFGFTDPAYQISLEDIKQEESSGNNSFLRFRIMRNNEIEIDAKHVDAKDGISYFNLSSWQIQRPIDLFSKLEDRCLYNALRKFKMAILFDPVNLDDLRIETVK